ncbi:tripartite tricarboxylate transporter permease [Arthrobacter sp. 260]|uniref:tripartite tricarboxylate transporter permease n=1 Tax=Arthrobacter sp. 260 TaxID=2735314 RepID=UPI0014918AC7|nr:tripartite tricarboxylate transporter permease [Arthrobacter sp. 260]NOJ60064.1 tripartite tricarboxylate transporter permease [Arthrobacter sp. 260]
MWDAAITALGSFLDPSTLLFLMLGVLAGLIVGVIPGLGGTAAVAILLPFIFVLEPTQAMALLIGSVAVVHSSDTISSVLIGIPGSASASVLLLDGHEMAKQGKAARALSIAFLSSMLGGVIGAIGLTIAIPLARPLVLAFGSPEIFMLTVLGISLTALLSKGNLLKGVLAGVFGVLLGQVGAAPTSPDYRFTFDSLFLTEGLDLVAVALGIFGIAEIIALVARRTAISNVASLGSGWGEGIRDVLQNWTHVLRGGLIGIWAGVLPGVGATAGTWMAYGQAQATAKGKDKKKFGKGDPRGIIAPESANNAVEAGDLIPTLLFGIPGGAPAALLLGALLIYGIEPGPRMITNNLDVIYVIIWSFAIASVVGSILCFLMAKPLSKLAFIRFPLLAAGLIPILFMSGFQEVRQLEIFPIMLALGLLGWLMKIYSIPRAPFLIGFVLSIPLERYYYLTANLYEFSEWAMRPGVLVMAAILAAPLVWALYRKIRPGKAAADGAPVDEDALNDAPVSNVWRLALSIGFLIVFVSAYFMAQSFSDAARLLPNIVTILGAALSVGAIILDLQRMKREGPPSAEDKAAWRAQLRIAALSTAWLVAFVALTYVFGLVVCAAIFAPIFLWRVANARWRTIVLYPIVIVAVLLVMREFLGVVLPIGYIYLGV